MPNGAVEVAGAIAAVFDRWGVTYAVGGTLALGAHGVPRMTFDVDFNVGLVSDAFFSQEVTDALAEECGLVFDHPLPEVRRIARDSGFVRGSVGPVKVDLFFPKRRVPRRGHAPPHRTPPARPASARGGHE